MLLPDSFDPPEGWTFMGRTLAEVIVAGVSLDEPAISLIAATFRQFSSNDVVRAYIYPQMVMLVVWDAPTRMWVGTVASRGRRD